MQGLTSPLSAHHISTSQAHLVFRRSLGRCRLSVCVASLRQELLTHLPWYQCSIFLFLNWSSSSVFWETQATYVKQKTLYAYAPLLVKRSDKPQKKHGALHTPCERAFMTIISGFRSVLLSLCCCSRWSIQSISSSCGKNNTSTRTIARAVVCVVDSQRQRHQRCSYTTLNNDNDDDATHIKWEMRLTYI